jgi:serine/threonine-protein kinase
MAVVFALFGQHPVPRQTSRFSIALPTEATIDPLRGSVAVSPDGTRMVYVTTTIGRTATAGARGPSIAMSRPGSPAPTAASDPFFSPDGDWIGFFARGSLQKVPFQRRRRHTSLRRPIRHGWRRGAPDGTIVFGGWTGGGWARVPATGGEPFVLAARHRRLP